VVVGREHSSHEDQLFESVARILDSARSRVARTVNTAMVHAYWLIGREIVHVEQRGADRAVYGDEVLGRLAKRLTRRFGKGWSLTNLKRIRQFYRAFPEGSAIGPTVSRLSATTGAIGPTALDQSVAAPFPALLSWSHYVLLLRVPDSAARTFYEIEAAREHWSVRELDRQMSALLYERLGRNRTPAAVEALADGLEVVTANDVIKDPFVLEFLDVAERPHFNERDLEQAIIDRLEAFLLEMGKGFCFVGRQRRITLDGDHFYVDLVFYNRLLRAFVLLDLKLGKLTHQDLGQMQMYVNFYDRYQRAEHEARTIGIVLCSDKNDAMVRITLPEGSEQIVAARYQTYLPSEDELRAELTRERVEAELTLRLRENDGESA
jgi:predicted nuclease of restriction endonuclease-like (RecB) superfamily